jgi:thiol-disulfide isomerase/thioredoxin
MAKTPTASKTAKLTRKPAAKSTEAGTLFFTATWCAPCQQMKKALARADAAAVTALLRVVDIDTPAGEKLAAKHRVQCVPTFIRPDGQRQEGSSTVKQLAKWIGESG